MSQKKWWVVALLEDFKNAEVLLVVSLKNRRQGIGTALLVESEEKLKELGVKRASILPLKEGAYAFLVKNGYQYVGHVKQEIGEQFVVAEMEKKLR